MSGQLYGGAPMPSGPVSSESTQFVGTASSASRRETTAPRDTPAVDAVGLSVELAFVRLARMAFFVLLLLRMCLTGDPLSGASLPHRNKSLPPIPCLQIPPVPRRAVKVDPHRPLLLLLQPGGRDAIVTIKEPTQEPHTRVDGLSSLAAWGSTAAADGG